MWHRLGRVSIIVELLGLLLAVTSLVVASTRGDLSAATTLRIGAVITLGSGAILWIAWVTRSIYAVNTEETENGTTESHETTTVWYRSAGRSLRNDLYVWTSKTETNLRASEVVSVTGSGDCIEIRRMTDEARAILSLKAYKRHMQGSISEIIPADNDVDVAGERVRYIRCEFQAKVEGAPYRINIRLRGKKGQFILREGRKTGIRKEVIVRHTGWEQYGGELLPIRADRECYISLDILPIKGLKGSNNRLFIRELTVSEMRPVQE